MLRRIYDWAFVLAGHRHALAGLAFVAFLESSVFPIPPDVMLLPMVLAAPRRAWTIAAVATAASVAGGALGYVIGAFLFEAAGRPILEFYGLMERFAEFREIYRQWGFWFVAGAGFTPFPYKVITIASGAFALDPAVFMLASTLSRAGRFFLEAALLWWFGPPIRRFVEGHLPLLSWLFFLLLLGGFVLARYVF